MPAITFYKHEPIPMEMHKVKIVQQLHLLPTAQRLEKIQAAGFNTFQLHNGDRPPAGRHAPGRRCLRRL